MNEVTNVQGVHSIAPSFKSAKTESKATTTPQQKEDGDKKLMLALAGLAATSAAVIYGVKSGKLQNALNKLKTKSKNTAQTVQNAVSQHSIKPQQKAAEAAKETVQKTTKTTTTEKGQKILKRFTDSNGDEIIIDNNGTAILNRKNGTFQVTHGTEQKFYDSSSLQPETPKILNHGDENFQVANRTEQKFYNSSSLQPETPKIESKIKNKPQSPNKSFYDSNGDEIIVDKNGTGILNRGDGIFQVTHGGTQKTYNSFDEFSKDLNSLVENYIKNPKKTKTEYRQLVKLVHPDNYAAKGITPEEEKVLNDLFTRLNKAA